MCDYIERGGDVARAARERFATAASPGFDSDVTCVRVGIANQTTMLSGESLAIAEEVAPQHGARATARSADGHFRSFDTICSATQERQDAVVALLEEPLDVMVVVGGYNSQQHLSPRRAGAFARRTRLSTSRTLTRWIPPPGTMRHQPIGTKREEITPDWLGGGRIIGITAGASTPNNKIGETVARICRTAGEDLGAVVG